MSVILLMKGPVCTYNAVHTNGPVAVRRSVKSQFMRAAGALHAANLGYLIKIHTSYNSVNDVFVKKLPSEMKDLLEANEDLCSLHEYTARFYMPTPACITQRLRDALVKENLVQEEHFVNSTWGKHKGPPT